MAKWIKIPHREFFCEKNKKNFQKYFDLKDTTLLKYTLHYWKTLSVKVLWKLMNFPYQILELELESLFIFDKRWDEKPRRAVLASVLD